MNAFLSGLESSGWLKHIKAILDTSAFISKVRENIFNGISNSRTSSLQFLLWEVTLSNDQKIGDMHQNQFHPFVVILSSLEPTTSHTEVSRGLPLHYIPPLFLDIWYSRRRDITGYFPANAQVGQANLIDH